MSRFKGWATRYQRRHREILLGLVQHGYHHSEDSKHRAIYATRCWSATAPKQCRSRNTEGILQKNAYNSFLCWIIFFWDRHILWPQQWCSGVFPPVPTSSLVSFSRRKPCTSRFAVLCRWPTITPCFWCGTFPLAAQVAKHGSDLPSNAVQVLEECNHEFFPNVHKLLRILCALPITSA